MNSEIIAVARGADKLALVREHGAEVALDVEGDDWPETVRRLTDGRGADVIYDPVGGDVFDESVRCIGFDGRLLIIGFTGGIGLAHLGTPGS